MEFESGELSAPFPWTFEDDDDTGECWYLLDADGRRLAEIPKGETKEEMDLAYFIITWIVKTANTYEQTAEVLESVAARWDKHDTDDAPKLAEELFAVVEKITKNKMRATEV